MFKKALVGIMILSFCFGFLYASSVEVQAEDLHVGYVVNYMSHEWYQNIIAGAEERAEDLGVELTIADAEMDSSTQISAAENLIAQGVDVLVLTPVDVDALAGIVREAQNLNIPVISESNFLDGAETFVGIDNEGSGELAGDWLVEYSLENDFEPRILVIGLPHQEDTRQRVSGFKTALEGSDIEYEIVQEVDGEGLREHALARASDALTANPDINVIYGINDDSTTGGMSAYSEAGLDEDELVAIGFGLEGSVGQEALLGDTPYKTALAMFPNYVGASLIDASIMANEGEDLPDHYETPTLMITEDNFFDYYNEIEEGVYEIDFEALDEIMEK